MSIRVGVRHMGRVLGRRVPCPDPEEIVCSIFSTYNLCIFPIEEIVAQPTSTYVVCVEQKEFITVSPTSAYSLAVA